MEKYYALHESTWKNIMHCRQWQRSFGISFVIGKNVFLLDGMLNLFLEV